MRRLIISLCFLAVSLWAEPLAIRAAVIGGVDMSGLWEALVESFEKEFSLKVDTVISAPKHDIEAYCRKESCDFITMHASDSIANLAFEGYLESLTPWLRNEQLLLSHADNVAHIDQNDTLQQALAKIVASEAPFVIHGSGGTFEVYGNLRDRYGFHPKNIHYIDSKQELFKSCAALRGYTLFGVIPYLMNKRFEASKMKAFIYETQALRRPYLAGVAPARRIGSVRHENAQKLLRFLQSPSAIKIIMQWRLENHETQPVFYTQGDLQ